MKRHAVLTIALLMIAGMLFAGGEQEAAATADEPAVLSFFANNHAQQYVNSYSEVLCYQVLEEQLNIRFDWVHPTDATAELNVMIASGDLTDLIQNSWGGYSGGLQKAYDDGVVMRLNDHLDKVPTYTALMDRYPAFRKEVVTDDGNYLAFHRIEPGFIDRPYVGFHIRQDWLDQLGLEMPTTIDEWHDVLVAFKEADLAGTGGPVFGGRNANLNFLRFSAAWGVLYEDFSIDPVTGKVIYPRTDPRFRDFLETMLQWIDEGLIDPEQLLTDESQLQADYVNGRVGAMYHYVSRFPRYGQAAREVNPNYNDVAAPYPVGPAGRAYAAVNFDKLAPGDSTVITTQIENLDAALRWFNNQYTEEGSTIMNWGVEGVSYEVNNGQKAFIVPDSEVKKYARRDNGSARIMDIEASFASYTDHQREQTQAWVEGSVYGLHLPDRITHTTEESRRLANLLGDLQTFSEETIQKILLGAEPITIWDDYVETATRMGVTEVVAIKQAALDRYNAR